MTHDATRTYNLRGSAGHVIGAHTPKMTAVTTGQTEASLTVWATDDGRIDTGLWEATPGTFTASRDGYSEICTLLSGRVTITGEGEDPVIYESGDIVAMPSGWRGVWEVHETVRKHYTVIKD